MENDWVPLSRKEQQKHCFTIYLQIIRITPVSRRYGDSSFNNTAEKPTRMVMIGKFNVQSLSGKVYFVQKLTDFNRLDLVGLADTWA